MSSSALPPPSNLPSWSRVSTLDRSRYPKPFLRDRLPLGPAGATTITADNMVDFNASIGNVDVKFLEKVSNSGQNQSVCYDKSIKFLQQQHAETLRKLHEELDALKRQNKELQFKVVLAHQASDGNVSKVPYSVNAPSDIKTLLLQEEIKDLKQALHESSAKNSEMQLTLNSLQSRIRSSADDRLPISDSDSLSKAHRRKFSVSSLSTPLPLNATLNPLRVRRGAHDEPRIPSVAECEVIIQQMHDTNCQQLAELSKLRTDLRNITSTSTTPDSYVMRTHGPAKSESFSDTRLPRIPVKPATKKTIKSANVAELKVTLPALKNTITSNVADRQKRHHAMLKQQKSNKKF